MDELQKIEKGDWIAIPSTIGLEDKVGYVVDVAGDSVFYQVVKNGQFKETNIIALSKVKKLDVEITEEGLLQLIDLALALGDKDWFKELTNKLNSIKGVSV